MYEEELKRIPLALNGGLDEYSPVSSLAQEDYLEFKNFRLTKDGKRIEKRLGLSDLGLTEADDIYGYGTYYDSDGAFCQLLATESKLKRKVASAAWATIHTWTAPLVHPIRFLEIQGKQFAIAETDSCMVHTNKTKYQIGITAPATLPTLAAGAGGSMVAGEYRYAVTHCRSGNYGCESNPIKSTIGSVTFTGSGLNDMTASGDYTGSKNITVKVRVDGTGTPNTVEVSYDGGTTWHITDLAVSTTVYLHYGIILTFAATTGHTATNYWTFPCSACAVTVTANQQVTLTNIPVSTDPQVDTKKLYRTVLGGARFYWHTTITNATTSLVDNIEDGMLGEALEEDRDILPNGRFSEWWDNRLWVSGTGYVYYSDTDKPEEFDTSKRYIGVRQARQGDKITQMIAYNDNLYIFTEHNIFIVQKKAGGAYGRYRISADVGCIAPWSMVEANSYLHFMSFRGIEVFNGSQFPQTEISIPVSRTWGAADKTKFDFISAVHNRRRSEVWFAIPDSSTGTTKKAIVLNYIRNKYYIFEWHKIPSFLGEAKDISKEIQSYMGTRDGYVFKCDSGYQDGSTNISTLIRKGWYDAVVYGACRHFHVEYEIPDGKTLNLKYYVNFEKTEKLDHDFSGITPTSTDLELRRPIKDHLDMDMRGEYFSFVLSNNENVGGDLKINSISMMLKGGTIKAKVHGD